MEVKAMNAAYMVLKILMWILIILFAGDFIMQTISYSFYKGDKELKETTFVPQKIQISDKLSGYGYNLSKDSDYLILCFGGSMYIAYNTAGMYSGYYDFPFLSADYYGTQDSKGKMNLHTMQQSAEELYDWAKEHYPEKEIIVIGHSYGCGMAAYLASVRECRKLILLSGYRTSADMYNKIIPIYRGFLQVFIKNNIRVDLYAKNTSCSVTIIGSDSDTTFSEDIQKKLANCYSNAEIKIFHNIKHEDYLTTPEVIEYLNEIIRAANFDLS